MSERQWILVAGPYTAGRASSEQRAANLLELNEVALEVFRLGHFPLVGVTLALPLIGVAGPDSFDEIMMPVSMAAAERCDAVLRIGGESPGADREVEVVLKNGGALYCRVDEIPSLARGGA